MFRTMQRRALKTASPWAHSLCHQDDSRPAEVQRGFLLVPDAEHESFTGQSTTQTTLLRQKTWKHLACALRGSWGDMPK